MPKERSSRTIGIALAVILIIAAGVALYYYQQQREKTIVAQQFQKKYLDAKSRYSSGDYSNSIDVLNSQINNAPDMASLGKNQLYLAANLYQRGQGDDIAQSIKTYKAVINDNSFPPNVRALALNALTNIVIANNVTFYTKYFSDPPFDSYLPPSGTDRARIMEAYRKLLENSDNTFPNSYSEYAIAGYYYVTLIENRMSLGTTTMEQAAGIMEDYIKEADERSDDYLYAPETGLRRYIFRALAINTSSKILKKENFPERENAFKLILEGGATYEKGSNSFARFEVMRGRFYYADFLSETFGEKRYHDARIILEPFAEASSESDPSVGATRNYFAGVKKTPDTNFVKIKSKALAKISPEFRNFLISVGWTEKDLK